MPLVNLRHGIGIACAVAVAGSVVDVLRATANVIPPYGDGPAAFRTSTAILIAMGASNPVEAFLGTPQRFVVAVALLILAVWGRTEASDALRSYEAAYVGFVLLVTSKAFSRQSSNALRFFGATLLHVSARELRALEARWVECTSTGAVSSVPATAALVIGAILGVATGAFLLFSPMEPAVPLLALAAAQACAANVATMEIATYTDQLDHLFGACWAGTSDCVGGVEGATARRFIYMATCSAVQWNTALAAFIAGVSLYATSAPRGARECAPLNRCLWVAVAAALWGERLFFLTTMVDFPSAASQSAEAFVTDAAVLVTNFVAMPLTWIGVFRGEPLPGAAVFWLCVGADEVNVLVNYGFAKTVVHYTHCNQLVQLVMFALHVFGRCVGATRLERVAVDAGSSAALFLHLGSSTAFSAFDGSLPALDVYRGGERRFQRTAAAWVLEHWLGAFVWFAVWCTASRSRDARTSRASRAGAAALGAALPVVLWGAALAAGDLDASHTANWYASAPFVVGVVSATVLPWAAALL
jgi:hypothetical protein